MIHKGETISKMDTTKLKLNEQQKEDLGAYTGFKESITPESQHKEMDKNLRQDPRELCKCVYKNISDFSARLEFIASYYFISGIFWCLCFLEWLFLNWEY